MPGIDGTPRYSCVFTPPDAGASSRPLLLFFHGSGGGADNLYDHTLLRAKAVSYNLTNDSARRGFVVVSPQARNLHWPTEHDEDGAKIDIYYRDLGQCSKNPDFAALDAQLDDLVRSGVVDPKRIYVTGWSNGARSAQAYAIARHETPTPGGNRVAAAAVYSGADPFNTPRKSDSPSCALDPYPTSTVPIFIVSGSCDAMPCNEQQAATVFATSPLTPGSTMATWVSDLSSKVRDPNVFWQRIRPSGQTADVCMGVGPRECTLNLAGLMHLDWPDGIPTTLRAIPTGGTVDQEPAMLDFLRAHPLP